MKLIPRTFRITEEDDRLIEKLAAQMTTIHGIKASKSDIVRKAIRKLVEEELLDTPSK